MKLTIREVLKRAITAHKEEKLEEAEQLYKIILESQPEHIDAINNLGILFLNAFWSVGMTHSDILGPLSLKTSRPICKFNLK